MVWFGKRSTGDGIVDGDCSGTKVYDVNGLTPGTGAQLQDQVGAISSSWLELGKPLDGAQNLLNIFMMPGNSDVLLKSREVRFVVFGDAHAQNKSPIQFLLDRGKPSESADVATRTKHEQLSKRYAELVASITGVEPPAPENPTQEKRSKQAFPPPLPGRR